MHLGTKLRFITRCIIAKFRLKRYLFMDNSKFLDELAKKITNLLPPGVKELGQDFEKNLKNILNMSFHKLELVTRKEFDIQARVLIKTREKLENLEHKLAALEEELTHTKKHGRKKMDD